VTVGPLVQLWRQARRTGQLPDPAAIGQAKALVGWRKVRLDRRSRTVRLDTQGMRLDLGGIAKGYAGDEALRAMRVHGVRSALIELGGDIVLGAAPPGARGWRIEAPNAGGDLWLKDCAVSSSGDTEQFVVIDGVRYSHVVDPRTGRGLTTRRQATVVAKDGLTSDPLSTALTVADDRARCRLLQRTPGLKVYMKAAGG
jgi:FAD:protein FMN transferase